MLNKIVVAILICAVNTVYSQCERYNVFILPEDADQIHIRPGLDVPIFQEMNTKDSCSVIGVYENEKDRFYEITDGKHIGYITPELIKSGLQYDKEECIKINLDSTFHHAFPAGFYISNAYVYTPNSVGGVSIGIGYRLLNAQKTIKYITFTVVPYNAVGDSVNCDVSREFSRGLCVTGPLTSQKGECWSIWENCWYNSTITCAVIKKVVIEYVGGSKKVFSKNIKEILVKGSTNECIMQK